MPHFERVNAVAIRLSSGAKVQGIVYHAAHLPGPCGIPKHGSVVRFRESDEFEVREYMLVQETVSLKRLYSRRIRNAGEYRVELGQSVGADARLESTFPRSIEQIDRGRMMRMSPNKGGDQHIGVEINFHIPAR